VRFSDSIAGLPIERRRPAGVTCKLWPPFGAVRLNRHDRPRISRPRQEVSIAISSSIARNSPSVPAKSA
jgi:hypothetical protein